MSIAQTDPPTELTQNAEGAQDDAQASTALPTAVDTPSPPPSLDSKRPADKGLTLQNVVKIGALALLLFVGYKCVRIGIAGWTLYQEVTALRDGLDAQSDAGGGNADDAADDDALKVSDLAPTLDIVATQFGEIENQMSFFEPVLRRLTWLPEIGPTVAQAPELLAAGRAGLELANGLIPAFEPLLGDSTDSPLTRASLSKQLASIDLQDAVALLGTSGDEIAAAAEHSEMLVQSLRQVDADAIDPRAGNYLKLLQPYTEYLPALLRMAPSAESLLGMDSPRNYLVVVQNNHELRATGGFLTAVGHVVMDEGEIGDIDFMDSYKVSRLDAEHPPAPEPLRRYMGAQLLLLRDANWSPDLPTSARMISAIYRADTGVTLDGVITIDLRAAELMVNALSPLQIEGADEPITGETLLDQILDFWSKPIDTGDTLEESGLGRWWVQRKDFMPKLADAALAKVQSDDVDYQALLEAAVTALEEGAIQIWIDDADVAEQLADLGWDGSLNPQPDADYVALVDSNFGFNKVDYVLTRSVDYKVEWPDADSNSQDRSGTGASAIATLTVEYAHPTPIDDYICDITPRYSDTYEDSAVRCYFNYVRLYAPEGSELIQIDGLDEDTAEEQKGEEGLQQFAGYFVMKPGETRRVTFRYTLPPNIQLDSYRLRIRRQAGSTPLQFDGQIGDMTFSQLVEKSYGDWVPSGE